jgi:hypothetical protein
VSHYAVCFSSAEVRSTEADWNWRSGPTWLTWISTVWRLLPASSPPRALDELAGDEVPHALLEALHRVLGDRTPCGAAEEPVVGVLPLAVVPAAVADRHREACEGRANNLTAAAKSIWEPFEKTWRRIGRALGDGTTLDPTDGPKKLVLIALAAVAGIVHAHDAAVADWGPMPPE